ncbi:type II secretion system protein GspJ [Pseudidiomarina salilacus]|uniref:type II secretion system protein GspJ n=1 Tax=Pseudidiomarina salilacus TaxID=3384452 RepID=UPI003985354F
MSRTPLTKGFTLVEVLVAIVVFAIIGLASAAVVNTMMRTNEQSAAARDALTQLQQAMYLVEQDMRQAVSRRTPRGDYYVRAGWFNPGNLLPRSELQAVRYFVNEDNELVREHFTYVDMAPSSEPTERVLLSGVESITIEPIERENERIAAAQFNPNARGGQGQQPEPMAIPEGVEVVIETERWGTIERVFVLNGGDFVEPSP